MPLLGLISRNSSVSGKVNKNKIINNKKKNSGKFEGGSVCFFLLVFPPFSSRSSPLPNINHATIIIRRNYKDGKEVCRSFFLLLHVRIRSFAFLFSFKGAKPSSNHCPSPPCLNFCCHLIYVSISFLFLMYFFFKI